MKYVILEKARPYTRVRRGRMERVRGYTRAGVRKAIMMGLIAVMATVFGVSPLVAQTKYAGQGAKDSPVMAAEEKRIPHAALTAVWGISLGMQGFDARALAEKYRLQYGARINIEEDKNHSTWLIEVTPITGSARNNATLKTSVFEKYGKPTGAETTNQQFRAWWFIGKDLVVFEDGVTTSTLRVMSSEYLASHGGKKVSPVTAVVDEEKISLQDRYVDPASPVSEQPRKIEKYKIPEKRIVVEEETFGVMERRRAESTVEDVFKYQVIDNIKYRKFGALYDNVAFTYVWTRADFIKDMERLPTLATSWETVRDIEAKAIYPWRVDVTAKIGYKDGSGETRFKTVAVQFRQLDDNNALTPHGGTWKLMAGDLVTLLPSSSVNLQFLHH